MIREFQFADDEGCYLSYVPCQHRQPEWYRPFNWADATDSFGRVADFYHLRNAVESCCDSIASIAASDRTAVPPAPTFRYCTDEPAAPTWIDGSIDVFREHWPQSLVIQIGSRQYAKQERRGLPDLRKSFGKRSC